MLTIDAYDLLYLLWEYIRRSYNRNVLRLIFLYEIKISVVVLVAENRELWHLANFALDVHLYV